MDFTANQKYKRCIKYIGKEQNNKKLSVNVDLNCNHELTYELLDSIQQALDRVFVDKYFTEKEFGDQVKVKALIDGDAEEIRKKAEAQVKKEIKEQLKLDSLNIQKLKAKNII